MYPFVYLVERLFEKKILLKAFQCWHCEANDSSLVSERTFYNARSELYFVRKRGRGSRNYINYIDYYRYYRYYIDYLEFDFVNILLIFD